jgi:hypothetical protein
MINHGHHRPGQGRAHRAQDAASVAGLLITTEAMVAELPKKEAASLPTSVNLHAKRCLDMGGFPYQWAACLRAGRVAVRFSDVTWAKT